MCAADKTYGKICLKAIKNKEKENPEDCALSAYCNDFEKRE